MGQTWLNKGYSNHNKTKMVPSVLHRVTTNTLGEGVSNYPSLNFEEPLSE